MSRNYETIEKMESTSTEFSNRHIFKHEKGLSQNSKQAREDI